MTRTPAFRRRSPPPICIRQELSGAVTTSASVARMCAILSVSIAEDSAGCLTANVPPNPQQVLASASSTRSIPSTARSSRSGASPACISRVAWQEAW